MSGAAPKQFLWGNTPAFCLVPKGDAPALLPGAGAGAAGEPAAGEQAADQPAVGPEPLAGEQGAGGGSGSGASASASAAGTDAARPSGPRSLLCLPEAHVCFAASGDMRNLVATVNGLDAAHPVRQWCPGELAAALRCGGARPGARAASGCEREAVLRAARGCGNLPAA